MRGARRDMVDVLLLDEGEEDATATAQPHDAPRPRPQPLTIGFSVALLAVAVVTVSLLRSTPEPEHGSPVTAPTVPPPVVVDLEGSDVRMLVIPGTVDGELTRATRTEPGEQQVVAGALPVPGVPYVVRAACLSSSGQSLTYGISPNGQDVLTSGTVVCDGQEVVSSVGDVPAVLPLVVTFGTAGRVDDIGSAYVVVVPAS